MIERPFQAASIVLPQALEAALESLRETRGLRRPSRSSSSEHIMGVVVKEITSEINIATDKVTVNSRKISPTIPPANMNGMNTATSDRLMETTVKPTSRAPEQRRAHARHARLDMPGRVLHDHDGIVDHESRRDGERHQREIVERIAEEVHRAEGADQRHRNDERRDQRRAMAVQENVDHQDDERHRKQQGLLDLPERGADGDRAVEGHHQIDLRIDRALEQGNSALTASIISMTLAPGCW